jgi:hypothetical protein
MASTFEALLLAQYGYLLQNVPIIESTQLLVAPAATVTFTVVNPTNRIWCLWDATTSASATTENFQVQLNGVVSSSYIWQDIQGVNSTSSAGSSGAATTSIAMGNVTGATATANYRSSGSFIIGGCNQTSKFITMEGTSAMFISTTSSIAGAYTGQYNAVGPVTSVVLSVAVGNFTSGSQFTFLQMG